MISSPLFNRSFQFFSNLGKIDKRGIAQSILDAEYAVRGAMVLRADQIKEEIAQGSTSYPFDKLYSLNIGNPQALTPQDFLKWPRQLATLANNPYLIGKSDQFPSDAHQRAQQILHECESVGAYTDSTGIKYIRNSVARFIEDRDNSVTSGSQISPVQADARNIFLSDGASNSIHRTLAALITKPNDGIMIPTPQYPLYSAVITLNSGTQIPYYLEEENQWGLNVEALDEIYQTQIKTGVNPRALVVLNPGNPTGAILTRDVMKDVVQFCHDKNLVLLADEVYQTNIYSPTKEFLSFRRILSEMNPVIQESIQLASFHSTSKGLMMECGKRGGYVEYHGFTDEWHDELYKLWSIFLCSNVDGQMYLNALVDPPKPGDVSYESHTKQLSSFHESFQRRSTKLVSSIQRLEGVFCNDVEGAMYVFPRIYMSAKALDAAAAQKVEPDFMYCREMLENTGLVLVPGSGFGQVPGTHHFRATFLPAENDMDKVISLLEKGHDSFMKKY